MKKALLLFWLLTSCATSTIQVAVIRVSAGDTLKAIAAHYKTSVNAILAYNRLEPGAKLRPGQILEIPLERRDEIESERRGGLLFGESHRLVWPVEGTVSSPFGRRRGRSHDGIDIRAPRDSEIVAAASGKVVHTGWMRGYGQTVIVEHDGFRTLYAHCRKLRARKGAWVEGGSVIATVGKTGNASGYHLHFEYRDLSGRTYDPLEFFHSDGALISTR